MHIDPTPLTINSDKSKLIIRLQQLEETTADFQRRMDSSEQVAITLGRTKDHLKEAYGAQRRQMEQIAQILAAYLPHNYPPTAGLDIAGHCRPCADVGGDFYDVITLPDNRIALVMADVSGHGAMAAISMATSRTLLRAAASEATPETTPADLIYRLSNWLTIEAVDYKFVTLWLGIWDQNAETLTFASAAHPPAVLWRAGAQNPEFLEGPTTFPAGLAGVDPVLPENRTIDFEVGDRLFLYTDGWNESESQDGEFLTNEEFIELLANSAGQPATQVPLLLYMELERFLANSRVRDDISLMVVDRLQ